MIAPDGSLVSLTISEPRRFLRDEFRDAKARGEDTDQSQFWRVIPGRLFVVLGTDIASINVRYPPRTIDSSALARPELSQGQLATIRDLLAKLAIKPNSEE